MDGARRIPLPVTEDVTDARPKPKVAACIAVVSDSVVCAFRPAEAGLSLVQVEVHHDRDENIHRGTVDATGLEAPLSNGLNRLHVQSSRVE